MYAQFRPAVYDFRRTRGGPVVRTTREAYANWSIGTDPRRSWRLGFTPEIGWNEDGGGFTGFFFDISWTPVPALSLTMSPTYSRSHGEAQYVDAFDDPTAESFFGTRYVFADLDSRNLSLDTRMNVTFTPNMTLQLFAQPFISSNDYSEWKEYTRTRDNDRDVFEDVTVVTDPESGDREITIDPDGAGPATSFSFTEPDFNLRSLRGNAVFRWEYMPGSTLFLVWTQDRASFENVGDFQFGRDRSALFDADAEHVFLIKINYWFAI